MPAIANRNWTYPVQIAALAALYWGAAKLGLSLAFATSSVTAIWPPTGIALAAIVLGGYRLWPGVALGAFLANSWTGVPIYTTFGITIGNTLEPVVGAYLLARFGGFNPRLERVRDIGALVVFAGVLSTTVSATFGVTSLLAGNQINAEDFGEVWRTWWLGDMGGDLIVAPVILVAVSHWPYRRLPGGAIEAVLVALVTGGLTAFIFTRHQSLTYALFPALLWAAFRFWQPGATAVSLLVAAIAVPLTEHNLGPYAGASPDDRLLLTQTFVGVTGMTILVLASVISARRRAEDLTEEIAETLQSSLLPSELPVVPGLEVEADFHAAGERHIVGGDFYDFAPYDGGLDIVIGDVCGKGAPAAALTGLARYTLRAAASRGGPPSDALQTLNDEILKQRPGDFCTAVYARLRPSGDGGFEVTMANGGHPLPVVLRASGAVEGAGVNGTLLGVIPEPEVSDRTLRLSSGDALILYTDGLIEAEAPRRIASASDLASAVRPCAGQPAASILNGIEGALLRPRTAQPRDDIALIVVRAAASLPVGDGRPG
jgi:integral membrane sensor domain MASE1